MGQGRSALASPQRPVSTGSSWCGQGLSMRPKQIPKAQKLEADLTHSRWVEFLLKGGLSSTFLALPLGKWQKTAF